MNVKPQTLNQLRRQIAQGLRTAGVAEPDLESRWYLSRLLKISEVTLWTEGDSPVSPEHQARAAEFVARRAQGEPFAYILGFREFYSREFIVNKHTLIPRPETELVIQRALYYAVRLRETVRIADFGTGTGCIGLTLLCEIPESELVAVDLSAEAVAVAEQNAEALNVKERARFIHADVSRVDLPGEFDLVVANPPYIDVNDPEIEPNVKKFEPHSALFAADEGYKCIKEWLEKAAQVLKPGGLYLCEIGAKQADRAVELAETLKVFSSADVLKDLAQKPRVLRAQKAK